MGVWVVSWGEGKEIAMREGGRMGNGRWGDEGGSF